MCADGGIAGTRGVVQIRPVACPGLFGPVEGYYCRMPGEPRTGRGRASRERIVERAAELVAEHGVAGTSLDEVLAAAGASKSQHYHYFAGRDELVEAAVARR